MGKKVYTCTALTGSAEGALDALNGLLLNDGDLAIVVTSGRSYIYELDHDNSSTEASPWVISPDKNYGTKRWLLRPSGDAYYSMASAYLTSDQTISHNTWTKISGYTENYDLGSNFASDQFVAPVAGYYHFDFQARFYDAESKLTYTALVLFKNAASNLVVVASECKTDSSVITLGGSGLFYLAAGDYVDLRIFALTSDTNSFKAYNGFENTYLNVHLFSV